MLKASAWRRFGGLAAVVGVFVALAALVAAVFPSLTEADSATLEVPHTISGMEQCLNCHGEPGPTPVPPDHSAYDESECLNCHSPSGVPTQIAHSAFGQEQCLNCHGAPGPAPIPPDHSAYDESECLNCHSPSGVPPQIAHGASGLEQCFTCHGPSGISPVPPSHSSYVESGCLDCHSYSATPAEMAHNLTGWEDCLSCHGTEPVTLVPASHVAYEDSDCLDCHSYSGVPPEMAHSLSGWEDCLDCHGTQGVTLVPASHLGYNESICLDCHYSAESPPQEGNCLTCHGIPGLIMTLDDGELLPLFIDSETYTTSIHGDKLLCTDCHSAISTYPHPERDIAGRREYSVAQYELCKRCHFAEYTRTLDSMHYEVLSSGDLNAPLCTDCHGAHDVTSPSQPRSRISQTCSKCHQGIYEQYADSIHGKALIGENNYDVPVCTDCHQTHNIEDPRTAAFRLESVDECSSCHTNEELMGKYGISTAVLQTYLQDFHGQSVSLIEKQSKDVWAKEAVCTDCHGIHDIQAVDNPDSPVMKDNLLNVCRQPDCHPDATANFPSAWLSHYEPSLSHAPVVYTVQWFYKILIPFILLGLVIHVLLDIWRAITNR